MAGQANQEYNTYFDKDTGHHRLKGGAMEIREPTDEDIQRNREELMRELEEGDDELPMDFDADGLSPTGFSDLETPPNTTFAAASGGMNVSAPSFVPRATAPAFIPGAWQAPPQTGLSGTPPDPMVFRSFGESPPEAEDPMVYRSEEPAYGGMPQAPYVPPAYGGVPPHMQAGYSAKGKGGKGKGKGMPGITAEEQAFMDQMTNVPTGPPQEYVTYLDTSTGHQRLKGGALLIKEPTEEDLERARQEQMQDQFGSLGLEEDV